MKKPSAAFFELVSDRLKTVVDTYFDGVVNPGNIKHIEEYINLFHFKIGEDLTFTIRLGCDQEDLVIIESFKVFKNGQPIN